MIKIILALLLTIVSFDAADAQALKYLPVTVGEVKFFEGDGRRVMPKDERVYTDTFRGTDTKYVYYELAISPKEAGQSGSVRIGYFFYHPSGSLFCSDENPMDINDTVTSTYAGCSPESGHWTKGTYTVVLTVNGEESSKNTFTIE